MKKTIRTVANDMVTHFNMLEKKAQQREEGARLAREMGEGWEVSIRFPEGTWSEIEARQVAEKENWDNRGTEREFFDKVTADGVVRMRCHIVAKEAVAVYIESVRRWYVIERAIH